MPERILAKINPAALVWARESRGMSRDVAASKIGVSAERLAAFEEGTSQPTVGQLREIGRVFRKPTAFFYLSQLPARPERLRDFRHLPRETQALQSSELIDAVARARQRRADAVELARLLDEPPKELGVEARLNELPSDVAQRLRDRLEVSIPEQQSWREPYRALRGWTDSIEAAGVLVSQFGDVDVEEARGFSLGERQPPLVALNGKDSPRAKIFTLFHELVHIIIGAGGLCDLHDSAVSENALVEQFCNQVAADALVPIPVLLAQPIVQNQQGEEWGEWQLRELATSFSVSQEVILRRLLTIGRTTTDFYQRKRQEYRDLLESSEGPSGFIPYYRRVLRDNGSAFTNLALAAYRVEAISSLELSRVLGGVNLRHVPAIEAAISRGHR